MTDLLLLSDLHFTRISSSTYSSLQKIESVVGSLLLDRMNKSTNPFLSSGVEELKQALS